MAAHQQLLGGASFEIKAMTRRGHLGHIKVRLRSFSRPARVDQGVGKSALEIDQFSAARRRQFERAAIESGRAIEGERAGRFFGGHGRVRRGAHSFPGAEIVFKERFRIVDAAAFECLGQPAVNLSNLFRIQLGGQRFANAIVIKLERVSRLRRCAKTGPRATELTRGSSSPESSAAW